MVINYKNEFKVKKLLKRKQKYKNKLFKISYFLYVLQNLDIPINEIYEK
jgi:hypothetical protein